MILVITSEYRYEYHLSLRTVTGSQAFFVVGFFKCICNTKKTRNKQETCLALRSAFSSALVFCGCSLPPSAPATDCFSSLLDTAAGFSIFFPPSCGSAFCCWIVDCCFCFSCFLPLFCCLGPLLCGWLFSPFDWLGA